MTEKAPTPQEDLYYQAIVTGWITTKLERDKSILALAGGGIGAVVTLMTTVGPTSMLTLVLYVLAIVAFVVALITIVIVLDKNADHFEAVAVGKTDHDPKLQFLDKLSFGSFATGAMFLALVGVIVGYHKLTQLDDMKPNKEAVSPSSSGVLDVVREPVQINITNTQAGGAAAECITRKRLPSLKEPQSSGCK